jgi:predicted MPP superfamily phosphohydrolase
MEFRLLVRSLCLLAPLIAAQVAIYRTLKPRWRWAANAVAVIAIASVSVDVLSMLWLFGLYFHNAFGTFLSEADAVGLTWLFTSTPAYVIYWMVSRAKRKLPEDVSPERRRLLQTAATVAVASPFAVMAYGMIVGRLDFGVREGSLAIPGLHPDLEGLRVLHLSDVHLGQFLSEREFERVIDMANGLKPNLAIMTGDLITKPGDPMETCVRQLARVRSDAGMFGCMGNHEMYSENEAQTKTEGARHGITFLRHENRQLRFGNAVMNIGGVDYQRSDSRKDYLKGAQKLVAPGALNVLLSHNPDVFPVSAGQGWDLTLSGHTHGGQVTLEIVEQNVNLMRFFTPYVAGEYHLGNAASYVTRGIGTVGLPARVGVPPEITLLRLRKA